MYKLFNDINGNLICINHLPSGKSFGAYEDNIDYQQYLVWLSEGNEPIPADEQGTV